MNDEASRLPRTGGIKTNRDFCELLHSESPWTAADKISDHATLRLMIGRGRALVREWPQQPSPASWPSQMFLAAAVMLAAVAALMGSGQPAARPAGPFEVGRPFPLLALPDVADGRPRSIADFRGRKIILHVFASW